MAKHIQRLAIIVTLDSNEVPTAVVVKRYRVEDTDSPGVKQPESGKDLAMSLREMNKTMHNNGAVGEVIKDCVALCRAEAGI